MVRINHRRRFFKALDLEEPDHIPITDLALDPPIVDAILGRGFYGGVFIMSGGSEGCDDVKGLKRLKALGVHRLIRIENFIFTVLHFFKKVIRDLHGKSSFA